MTIDTVEHVPVLIAGAGPVGLTLPLELEHHGVDALLVERNTTTTRHPKMDITNGRSMELFHRLGIADCLRKLAVPADHPIHISLGRRERRPDPCSQRRHAAAGAQHAGLTDPARAASAAGVTSSGPQGFSGDRTLTR